MVQDGGEGQTHTLGEGMEPGRGLGLMIGFGFLGDLVVTLTLML